MELLKSNVFLTPTEVADWLKFEPAVLGVGHTPATLTVGDLKFTATPEGTGGNTIQIELVAGGTAGSEQVTVSGKKVSVKIEDGVSTADQILAALAASALSPALLTAELATAGTGSNPQAAAAAGTLTGGAFPAKYDARTTRVLSSIINAACQKVESIIHGPVLAREFTEEHDGSNSNVIVPDHRPVLEITELKIDYNRAFGSTSLIDANNYFIRGQSDLRQAGELQIRKEGSDIVLRDDNERYVLGRIFAGSVLGSIRLKYKAGWGKSMTDLPEDIRMAGLQLVEWYYYQRENRDLGVTSKGVKGESYAKITDGIPDSIIQLLESYIDYSFGSHAQPQFNYNEI